MQIAHSRNHKKLTINRIYLDQIRKDDVVGITLILNSINKIINI